MRRSYEHHGEIEKRSRMLPKLNNIENQWSTSNTKTTTNDASEKGIYATFRSLNNFALKPSKGHRKSMETPISEYISQEQYYPRSGVNSQVNLHAKTNRFNHPQMIRPRKKKSSKKFNIHMI